MGLPEPEAGLAGQVDDCEAVSSVRGSALAAVIPIALAADTVSIAVMEIVDNAFLLFYPGAIDAGLGDLLFWGSLAAALAIAFVVTVPVNRWMIGRGKGHAVVHGHH